MQHLRALFNTLLEWITNNASQSIFLLFLQELIIDMLMYKGLRPNTATLSLKINNYIDTISIDILEFTYIFKGLSLISLFCLTSSSVSVLSPWLPFCFICFIRLLLI
ncbi:hypothetical protein AAHE18_03G195500 [Arachis hypogaea]